MLSVKGLHLGVKVHPRTLRSCTSALWFKETERASGRIVAAVDGLDSLSNTVEKELISEWLVTFNLVEIKSNGSLGLVLLLFLLLFLLIDVGLLCGVVKE